VVAGERGRLRLDDLIGDEDDVAVAAITVAELLDGVELADAANQARRRALVGSIVATIPIEDYDLEVARSHALLLAHAHRSGRAGRGRGWSGARTTMVPFMPAAQWPRTWQP
jgi:tRNA(fMet)-specific endonuclease VapC